MKKIFIGFLSFISVVLFLGSIPPKRAESQKPTPSSILPADTALKIKQEILQKRSELEFYDNKVDKNQDTLSALVDQVVAQGKRKKVVYVDRYISPPQKVGELDQKQPCFPCDSTDRIANVNGDTSNDYVSAQPEIKHDTVYVDAQRKFFLFRWFSKKQNKKK